MAKFNAILGDIRGSIAGDTFSRNTFGAYVRQKVTPVNPATNRQELVRAALASTSGRWGATLTPAQRAAWVAYAAGTPSLDVFGNQVYPTGLQRYVGTNILRNLASTAFLDAAPTTPGSTDLLAIFLLSDPSGFTIGAAGSASLENSFGSDDLEAATDSTWLSSSTGVILQAQLSPRLPAGVQFYVGPYTSTAYIVSNAALNELDMPTGDAVAAGDRYGVRLRKIDAEGKISQDIYQIVTAAVNV